MTFENTRTDSVTGLNANPQPSHALHLFAVGNEMITNDTKYGLKAILFLAKNDTASLGNIADRENISIDALSTIFQKLERSGFINKSSSDNFSLRRHWFGTCTGYHHRYRLEDRSRSWARHFPGADKKRRIFSWGPIAGSPDDQGILRDLCQDHRSRKPSRMKFCEISICIQ